jgi:hypothetical protein
MGSRAPARMKRIDITHQHSQQQHEMHACHPNLQDNHRLLINMGVLRRVSFRQPPPITLVFCGLKKHLV